MVQTPNKPNQRPNIQLLEQGDLFSSCVPVSVKQLDQDKDADKNVDADHVRTVRPVESEQSIDLFTQREEIDIDFRVSGLPHAVVKQAENFRVRELVKKIESHPHREALQADGQGDGVPKACRQQALAAADSRGSRTCVCADPLVHGWHTQGVKDESTSCRGTVKSAWQKPPVRRKGGRAGLPKKGRWPPRGTGTTVLTYPGSAPR